MACKITYFLNRQTCSHKSDNFPLQNWGKSADVHICIPKVNIPFTSPKLYEFSLDKYITF